MDDFQLESAPWQKNGATPERDKLGCVLAPSSPYPQCSKCRTLLAIARWKFGLCLPCHFGARRAPV